MARIRSVLPGQWTDEEFVSCSFAARLLAIAIRNEADDQGIFEWKPIGLKMKLMPADAVDINQLLTELEANNQVKSFELDGRKYGLIRNFRLYQRPKKPNKEHVLPDEFRIYVGLSASSSELDEDYGGEVPQNSENPPQREEVGGKGKDSELRSGANAPDLKSVIFGQFLDWLAEKTEKSKDSLRAALGRQCKLYGDSVVVDIAMKTQKESPIDPLAWMEAAFRKQGDGNQRRAPRQAGETV